MDNDEDAAATAMPGNVEPEVDEHLELEYLKCRVLSISLILERIAPKLSIDDLKTFRLVNSGCYKASRNAYKKNACVQLKKWGPEEEEDGSHALSCQLFTDNWIQASSQQNADNHDAHNQPRFQRVALIQWDWTKAVSPGEDRFWKNVGPSITYMRLHKCHLGYWEKNFLFRILRGEDLPRLETLVVEDSDFVLGYLPTLEFFNFTLKRLELSGPIPFSSWNFLQSLPSLTEIRLAKQCGSENFIKYLSALRHLPYKVLSLEELDMIDTYQPLSSFPLNLPLKRLAIRVSASISLADLATIFGSYSNSLESIKIFRTPRCKDVPFPDFSLEDVSFSNLVNLELWGNIRFDIDFFRRTPALKRFRLETECYEKRDIIDYYYSKSWNSAKFCKALAQLAPITNFIVKRADDFALKDMNEFIADVKLKAEEWKILKDWMPNLKKIRAPLDNDSFRVVCESWPMLEELKLLFPSDVDDEGITGLKISEELQDNEARLPNITDLTSLESFELQVKCGEGKLTDFSAKNAFLRMPALHHLKVYADKTLMSEEMVEKMKENIVHVEVLWNCSKKEVESEESPKKGHLQECCTWTRYHYRFFTCHCHRCETPKKPIQQAISIARDSARRNGRSLRSLVDFGRRRRDRGLGPMGVYLFGLEEPRHRN